MAADSRDHLASSLALTSPHKAPDGRQVQVVLPAGAVPGATPLRAAAICDAFLQVFRRFFQIAYAAQAQARARGLNVCQATPASPCPRALHLGLDLRSDISVSWRYFGCRAEFSRACQIIPKIVSFGRSVQLSLEVAQVVEVILRLA